jgi:zinc protease
MLDRKTAPGFNKEFTFDIIDPVSSVLSNGIPVYFINGGEQNVIKVELILPAGRWVEHITGASHFTTTLLQKGTKDKTSYQIAALFDSLGVHFESSPGVDVVSLSIFTLVKRIEPALRLLLEIVTGSTFPEKELQQAKAIYLENLKVNYEKTSFVASNLIRKNIFGAAHPYGREIEEPDASAIRQEHLVNFREKYFTDILAVISGKLSQGTMDVVSSLLSSISNERLQLPPQQAVVTGPTHEYKTKEGSVQTSLRLGKPSLRRSDPGYADVLFLNHILGGYFGSRLMKNLREEKGLTYGISSSLRALKYGSYLLIGTDVNKENKDLAIGEIKKEISILRNDAIPEQELETARNHFLGSIQTELSTAFAHADKIKNVLLYGLEADFYNKLVARLETVSAQDLAAAAQKHLHEENFFEVAVG